MSHEVSVLIKDENSKSILSPNVTKIYGDISDRNDIEFFIISTLSNRIGLTKLIKKSVT